LNVNVMKISFRFFLILIIAIVSYSVIFLDKLLIDTIVIDFINSIRCDFLDFFMKFITSFGNTSTVFILLCVVLWGLVKFIRNKKIALIFLISLCGNVLFNQLLKVIVARERPIDKLINIGGFSFPSGHAMVSMFFYGGIMYLISKLVKRKVLRIMLIIMFAILIFLIGFSRIYLGVHYFSDVLVGFLVSILFLDLFRDFVEKYKIFT